MKAQSRMRSLGGIRAELQLRQYVATSGYIKQLPKMDILHVIATRCLRLVEFIITRIFHGPVRSNT
jgi:hypothetical protein